MLKSLLPKRKPKPTGVSCHFCGWNGPREQLTSARVLNTDGTPYTIQTCPQCARNGGLVFHEPPPK